MSQDKESKLKLLGHPQKFIVSIQGRLFNGQMKIFKHSKWCSWFFASVLVMEFVLAQPLLASDSAVRAPNENWMTRANLSEQAALAFSDADAFATRRTPLHMSNLYSREMDLSQIPTWKGTYSELQLMFAKLRDQRLYQQPNRPGFLRRATWLYPADGCYARAAHAARAFEDMGFERPGKVFAFGNLRMKTKFDKKGIVYWWYHVAAAFRFENQLVVLDPGAEAQRPVPLDLWLEKISSHPNRIRLAMCDSRAYIPSTTCIGGSESQEKVSIRHQEWLLGKEWARLVALNMNPESMLGEEPPWLPRFPWSE